MSQEINDVEPVGEYVRGTVSFAVQLALAVVGVILLLGAAVGGNYLLTLHVAANVKSYEAMIRHRDQVNQRKLQVREAESGIRTGLPVCKAIVQMDDASHGAVNASHSHNSYGHRLARAITNVDKTSHCKQIVFEFNHGWSIHRILLQQEKEQKQEEAQNGQPPANRNTSTSGSSR